MSAMAGLITLSCKTSCLSYKPSSKKCALISSIDKITEEEYIDDTLFASMTFTYRNTPKVQVALADWWYLGSLYFTCDQVQLPYVLCKYDLSVKIIEEDPFNASHIKLISRHS